ncbi:MAG: polysaccharide biosynthesis tyrosine autokinase [Kiritimatiellae bacterium]|nr:polysaccharide biosynthesis tyrosine autokinase [Kiritimatiellia bacterium]
MPLEERELVFSDYLRVLVAHKWFILIVAVLVLFGTWMWTQKERPVYESRTRIKIQRTQTVADILNEAVVSSGDVIANYIYEIKSEAVLKPAADLLAAQQRGEAEDLLGALKGAVRSTRVQGTDFIDIFATAFSPKEARLRTAAVLEAFVRHHELSLTKNARRTKEFIQQTREQSMDRLIAEEAKLRKDVGLRAVTGPQASDLALLRDRLIEAKIKLQRLRDSGDYTDEFPEIVKYSETVKAIQEQIEAAAETELRAQERIRRYEQLKAMVDDMHNFFTRRLEEARIAEMRKGEVVIVVDHPTEARMVTAGKVRTIIAGGLLGLMLGIVLAFFAENMDTSVRTLVEIEEAFRLPVLGIIPHFSPHDIDVPIRPRGLLNRIKYSQLVNSIRVMRRTFGAWSTRWWTRRGRVRHHRTFWPVVAFAPRAPATEGYRAIRTSLQLAVNNGKLGAILVTSSGPAEGKTTTLVNLALTFAQGGRNVLVVGANMRRPTMYRFFGLERERGLSDILVGDIDWHEAIKDYRDIALGEKAEENLATAPGMEHLSLITCGGRTLHPAEWLSLPVFEKLVRQWEAAYDVVLIDGTPILPVPDSTIMSQPIGRVVIVYQIGVTPRDSMRRAISSLQKTGAHVLGIIINDIQSKWASTPDYYHYRKYYGKPEKKGWQHQPE